MDFVSALRQLVLYIIILSSKPRGRESVCLLKGEAREVHHHRLLIGAVGINPYLAFESLWQAT